MKRFLWMICFCCAALPFWAQTGVSELSRYPEADIFESLNGKRGILILARYSDLIIEIPNCKDVSVLSPKKGTDGYYRYHVIIGVDDTNKPKLEVSRMGSPYRTSVLATVNNADYLVAYRMEEVSNPIRLDSDQMEASDVHFNASEAAVEILSNVLSLQAKCSPDLQATVSSEVSKADNSVLVIKIVIPLANFTAAKKNVELIETRLNELDSQMGSLSQDAPEWDEIDRLEVELDSARAVFSSMCNVELYGEGTNYLSVDISDIGPRVKKTYVVVPIVIEKEVFVTQCAALMDQGSNFFKLRKYKEAREAYVEAMNTGESAVADLKPTLQSYVNMCDSCAYYDYQYRNCYYSLLNLKKSGKATQAETAEYVLYAIYCLQQISVYNPDDYYSKTVEQLQNLLADQNLQVKFTFVEWKTLSEGNYIPDVEIWTYYGFSRISSGTFSSDKKFRRMLKAESGNFQQVGQSGTDGIAEIELDRTKLPVGILFRPREDSGIKIVYMDFEDFMRQARGTFMKKQFRVKMFTK